MKTIRNIIVILLSIISVSASAQSFNTEVVIEEKKTETKVLPNITVLSLEGKEVEFTASCGMKHVVLCNITAPNLGNWMGKFKEAGIPSVSLISWAPILTKGMTKYTMAFYKKTFYKWQIKYGITYSIDCQQNMIKVWGLPKSPGCMYIYVLGPHGEVLYSSGATNEAEFNTAILEAAEYMK